MWKLEPLGFGAAEVAPITAITSEPVVIGRKTNGIADVPQFVAVHKKHAELRADGEGALLVRALGTQPVWRKSSSGLAQRFLATDGELRLHAGERLYLLHPESETPRRWRWRRPRRRRRARWRRRRRARCAGGGSPSARARPSARWSMRRRTAATCSSASTAARRI